MKIVFSGHAADKMNMQGIDRKEVEAAITKGMKWKETKNMRKNRKNTLEKLNKHPKGINFFTEHMLCLTLSNRALRIN